ncbi:hypothetical protein QMT25_03110 [Cronobacter dublinensis]|uniref:hypothetical protein n=1 Tax=Cronobacter dublinensis TaxID=413497 RepID=UPI0024C29AE8|nr:hypothetical protein [Cronobacter dublinensis]MDK1195946.1 hypothetical protein [Cronobacter dublinensis]
MKIIYFHRVSSFFLAQGGSKEAAAAIISVMIMESRLSVTYPVIEVTGATMSLVE